MPISVLNGTVSHLTTTSTVSGSTNKGSGTVRTSHTTKFRVDGKPVYFKNAINLADGDHVTLAGPLKGGEIYARAIRNDATNVIYSGSTTLNFVLSAVLIAGIIFMGFVLYPIAILLGLILIIPIIWSVYEGYQNQLATKAVEDHQ